MQTHPSHHYMNRFESWWMHAIKNNSRFGMPQIMLPVKNPFLRLQAPRTTGHQRRLLQLLPVMGPRRLPVPPKSISHRLARSRPCQRGWLR